jgi:hypothetical protein
MGLNDRSSEYLTTVGELNPLLVFEQFGAREVVAIAVAIWTIGPQTGLLEERGEWIRRFWQVVLKQMPNAQGTRLLWHTVFFVVPTTDAFFIAEQFKQLLKTLSEPALESYCLIGVMSGSAMEKLQLLDEMQSIISSERSFTQAQGFWIKLLNGDEVK